MKDLQKFSRFIVKNYKNVFARVWECIYYNPFFSKCVDDNNNEYLEYAYHNNFIFHDEYDFIIKVKKWKIRIYKDYNITVNFSYPAHSTDMFNIIDHFINDLEFLKYAFTKKEYEVFGSEDDIVTAYSEFMKYH